MIIGIKKASGKMVFNPESHTRLESFDTLIVLGEPSAIQKLEDLVGCIACADAVINKHRGEPHHHE